MGDKMSHLLDSYLDEASEHAQKMDGHKWFNGDFLHVVREAKRARESERRLVEALNGLCERLEHFQSSLSTDGDRHWILGEVRAALAAAGGSDD